MVNEKLFYVGVKALITNAAGQVLVMKTGEGANDVHWDIPGGRMAEGETPLVTLQREVAEETGITSLPDPSFLTAVIANFEIPIESGKKAGLVLMIYRVTVNEIEHAIRLSREHTAYEWVAYTEATARLSYKYPPEFTALLQADVGH